jgi:AraC-like DNA-binding protein
LFRGDVGLSPFAYLRLRRLSVAAQRLGSSNAKVIDVAFDFVFDSHEGFTRAFTRHFGLSPRQYRRERPPVVTFMPEWMRNVYEFTSQGGRSMQESRQTQTVFVQVVERPARRLVLKRGREASHYFQYCDEVGCEVWGQLGAIPDALHEPMGLWLPEAMRRPGTSCYVQGVEVAREYAGPIPAGFECIDLPACLWMVFQGPPFSDEEFEEAIRSLESTIREYRPEAYGFVWDDESGPRFQLEPRGERGYIEGRPVKRLETRVAF